MARITQQMIFARLWVALVMLWAGLRILAVEIWLVDYGVSIWWFTVIEVLSSVLYGVSSARLVKELSARRRNNSAKWGTFTLVGYVLPDTYLLSVGRAMPLATYLVVVSLAVAFAVIALVRTRASVMKITLADVG
ncbi:MAG: hypothetical protein NWP73_06010 [Ilumatobacteraceae bacterium]|nr:hypothetical protein [Ilumatobacteraceae bacterium]